MATLPFMQRGVGGVTPPVTTPGAMDEGDRTVTAAKPIGPTYNDIARAALMYGSKPGSSTPMLAQSFMPQSNWQQNQLNPLSTEPKATKVPVAGAEGEEDGDVLGSIAKFFMSFLGGV